MSFINKFKKTPFTYQEALKYGITRHQLRKHLESGEIIRISRGLYCSSKRDENDELQFIEATKKIKGKSAVGLVSALSYYNLTDIIPRQVWLIVPFNKRTTFKGVKVFRQRKPQWDVGIKKNKNFRITDLERTIIECLVYKKVIGVNEAILAIKKALNEKKTTLIKIRQMAKKLRVEHKIKPYLEVLM